MDLNWKMIVNIRLKFLKIIFVAIFILHSGFNFAYAGNVSTADVPLNGAVSSNGFLYLLEKDRKKFYLLGTIHGGFSERQKLGLNIINAAKKSSGIYVEVIMDDAALDLIDSNSKRKLGGKKLVELIGKKYYDLLKKNLVSDLEIFSEDEYELLQPWYLVNAVPIPNGEALNLELGTEEQLIKLAKENNIAVNELEGATFQTNIFNKMTEDQQERYFKDFVYLVELGVMRQRGIDLTEAWANSDISLVEKSLREVSRKDNFYSNFYIANLVNLRNVGILRKLEKISSRKSGILFAVGVDHLVGDSGLLKMLKDKKYKITKVN